ncbi:hypothetical protein VaNZ11_011091 [Volvox africanus]|uniref:Uncharacterized protein n=1 Tax=Volvox africanus TaxID=51714 RepID=A0ABQ5SC26_9CHLO|nr:hypothetical protein VaNZ11_011091 [Volvox africanus]
MEAVGHEHRQSQDPQCLLAQLASEYERSRRFLEQLENSFAKEPQSLQPAVPTYTPAWAEESLEQPELPAAPEPVPLQTGTKQPPKSVPSKLRAKLRSFFSRRNTHRDECGEQTVIRASSESQSAINVSHGVGGSGCASSVSERPSIAGGGPPTSAAARRTHQMYYATSSAEMPRVSRAVRDPDTRPNTATRRSSIVYFSGNTMDSTSQGWVARVAVGGTGGGDAPVDRPATGRRSSIVQYGPFAAAERPATARKAAVVQLNEAAAALGCGHVTSSGQQSSTDPADQTIFGEGDSVAAATAAAAAASVTTARRGVPFVPFGGVSGGGGGGGALQDVCNPIEFMSVMAGPRRTTSFQHRPGTALQPTAQRLRSSASVVRRTSIEVCAQLLPQQQQPQQQPAQPPQSPQQNPFQRGGGRGSLEGRQIWFTALSTSAEQLPSSSRRAGSLEISRPYSAATVAAARLHPAAAATGAAATAATATAAAPVNISSSALFSSTPLVGATGNAAALAATGGGGGGGGGGGLRCEVPSSPQSSAFRLRLQTSPAGVAWAQPLAAPSPSNSPGSAGSPSPAEATTGSTIGRARAATAVGFGGTGGGASPVMRMASSFSARRLKDHVDGIPMASTATVTTTSVAAAAAALPLPPRHCSLSPISGGYVTNASADETQTATGAMVSERAPLAYGSAVPHVIVNSTDETVVVASTAVATAVAMATAAVSPSSSSSPNEPHGSQKMLQPVVFHGGGPSLQPLQPPQESSSQQQQSPPSVPHMPHPPPHPCAHLPQGHAGFRSRGFGGLVTAEEALGGAGSTSGSGSGRGGGGGGDANSGSGCGGGSTIFPTAAVGGFGEGRVTRPDSPFAVCMDERVGAAVAYEGAVHSAV